MLPLHASVIPRSNISHHAPIHASVVFFLYDLGGECITIDEWLLCGMQCSQEDSVGMVDEQIFLVLSLGCYYRDHLLTLLLYTAILPFALTKIDMSVQQMIFQLKDHNSLYHSFFQFSF